MAGLSREELIRQFPAEVVEKKDPEKGVILACPTCGRPVTLGMDKCDNCNQKLSFEKIRKVEESRGGIRKVTLKFEVAGDFKAGDCRKCPLSFIGKSADKESVYECPLRMHANCKLIVE